MLSNCCLLVVKHVCYVVTLETVIRSLAAIKDRGTVKQVIEAIQLLSS
jgi:hypothetical protein